MDKKIIIGLTGSIIMSGATVISVSAAENGVLNQPATVTAQSLNLRSLDGQKIGSLFKGDKVTIERDLGDGFVEVKTSKGVVGKCPGQFLSKGNSFEKEITSSAVENKKVAVNNLEVRQGAGTEYKVVSKLTRGANVKVLATTVNGWSKVEYNGNLVGYCATHCLVSADSTETSSSVVSESSVELGQSDKTAEYSNVISSYSTRYATGSGRARNIEIAVEKINGTVIKPGEVFSYDKTVGERTPENGFKLAPVMANGEIVGEGYGGGICQVSSTLYAGALKAGLTDIQSRNHSGRVKYMQGGMQGVDAVITNGVDLKIRNTYQEDIVISASAAGGQINIAFKSVNPLLNGKTYDFNTMSSTSGLTVELQLVEKSAEGTKVVYKRTSSYVK